MVVFPALCKTEADIVPSSRPWFRLKCWKLVQEDVPHVHSGRFVEPYPQRLRVRGYPLYMSYIGMCGPKGCGSKKGYVFCALVLMWVCF